MAMTFSQRSGGVLGAAWQISQSYGQDIIGTEHLLAGILAEGEGIAYEKLAQAGISLSSVTDTLQQMAGGAEQKEIEPDMEMDAAKLISMLTPRSRKVVDLAAYEARMRKTATIEPEHLLLGIIRSGGEGVAAQMIRNAGLDPRQLYSQISDSLKAGDQDGASAASAGHGSDGADDDPEIAEINENLRRMSGQFGRAGSSSSGAKSGGSGKSKTPTLDKYGHDLTEMARGKKLDPVIGRSAEIDRVKQILCRRTKNNPVLIGEPGVGKTAIVEGLANQIVAGDIPEMLQNRRIITIDMAGMLAGSKYRGEFEDRLKKALNEAVADGNTILFIDEMHTLIGAGGAEGAMDAANILKPLLARGELQIIGATTINEYRKQVEKDAALERRFQPVTVGEPSPEDTVQILKGLRPRYEEHHHVQISDAALEAAVTLSTRYIPDRFLPDKAIDLIDEAASKLRLSKQADPAGAAELEEKLREIGENKKEAAAAERFEEAADLLQQEKELTARLEQLRQDWKQDSQLELGEDQIADIVASWTGIPVRKLTESDNERLRSLEEEIGKRVIGQDEAVHAVARAIRRGRLGLKDPRRPVGSFIFLGTTGVGKTELARALADVMFGDENAMIRLDMSEYMEKFDVSKLIGSPPGYVGYEEGGQLTEKVRRRPYSVVLFDEIEKAHPDVFNALLQIMEDGRLTDSQGRTVSFRNTILIMTSNIGARLLTTSAGRKIGFGDGTAAGGASDERLYGGKSYDEAKNLVMEELKKTFSPEFVNRVDEIIFFRMLSRESMLKIVDIQLQGLARRIREIGLGIDVTESARNWLVDKGYDPMYGARPLRRLISAQIEDRLSGEMLDERLHAGETAVFDLVDGTLTVQSRPGIDSAESQAEESGEAGQTDGSGSDRV